MDYICDSCGNVTPHYSPKYTTLFRTICPACAARFEMALNTEALLELERQRAEERQEEARREEAERRARAEQALREEAEREAEERRKAKKRKRKQKEKEREHKQPERQAAQPREQSIQAILRQIARNRLSYLAGTSEDEQFTWLDSLRRILCEYPQVETIPDIDPTRLEAGLKLQPVSSLDTPLGVMEMRVSVVGLLSGYLLFTTDAMYYSNFQADKWVFGSLHYNTEFAQGDFVPNAFWSGIKLPGGRELSDIGKIGNKGLVKLLYQIKHLYLQCRPKLLSPG